MLARRDVLKSFGVLSFAFCVFALAGCETTAVNKDAKTTFLNNDDMITMTDRMAQSIVADARVQAAWSNGPMKIVIEPVENLTNEIIPPGDGELFVARLQGLLAKQPGLRDKIIWVLNRRDFDRLRATEFGPQLGPSESEVVPEYALRAEFHSVTDAKRHTRSDLYLCQYKLTKISGDQTRSTIWVGDYQTSKSIKRSLLD